MFRLRGRRWKFQEPGNLVLTRNPAAPFVTTASVAFESPTDANTYRLLTWMWVFDGVVWQPLTLSISDWDTKTKAPKGIVREWTAWAGDRR